MILCVSFGVSTPLTKTASLRRRLSRVAVALSVIIGSGTGGILFFGGEAGAVAAAPKTSLSFLTSQGATTTSVTLHPTTRDYLLLRLANSGGAASSASSSPSLDLTVPTGTSVVSVQSIDASSGAWVGGTWKCTPGGTVKCTLSNAQAQPAVFGAGSQAIVAVVLETGAVQQTDGHVVAASARLGGAPSASTQALVHMDDPASGLTLSVTGPSQVRAGSTTQIGYQVVNQGAVDATSSGNGSTTVPAVTLSNLLPSGKFTGWSTTSDGWACSGAQNVAPKCSLTAATLAAGEIAPPLIISFTVASGAAAKTQAALAGALASWTVTINQSMNGSVATATQDEQLLILPRPAGKLRVQIRAVSSSMITAGKSVSFEVSHLAVDGFSSGIVDTITLPDGLTTSVVNYGGWSCPAGSGTVTCTFAGSVPQGGMPTYVITLNSPTTVTPGAKLLRVSSSGNSGEATAVDAQPLFVVTLGGPRIKIDRLQSANSSTVVTDGSSVTMVQGAPASASFAISNTGDRPIVKGATVTITAVLNPAMVAYLRQNQTTTPDFQILNATQVAGGPVCTVNRNVGSVSCSQTLTSAIAPGTSSKSFTFGAQLNKMLNPTILSKLSPEFREIIREGKLVTVTASVSGGPDAIAPITLDLRSSFTLPALPDVQPDLQIPALKLGAAASTASLQLRNYGAATRGGAVVTFVVPGTLLATGVSGSVCVVSAPASGITSQTITCTIPALQAGTVLSPSVSSPILFKLANISATDQETMQATISVGGSIVQTAEVPIAIDGNPALTLAVPANVQVAATGNSGELSVSFTPSSNAPDGQQYEATACLDSAMTTGCVLQNVTQHPLFSGLNPGESYYVTVTAVASGNYIAATSLPVSGLTSPAVSAAPRRTNAAPLATSLSTGTTSQLSPTQNSPPATMPSASRLGTPRYSTPPASGVNFTALCNDAVAAIAGAVNPISLSENLGGGISASITGLTFTGGSCTSPSATVSFTSGSLNLYGQYSATIGGGTINSVGFTINSASVTTPSGWPGGSLTLASTSPVTVPFSMSGSDSVVSLQGTFSGPGLLGLPLPAGWSAQTTFTFTYTSSVVGIAVSSTAGPSGTGLTISGSADTTGNFSVHVAGNMSLDGVTVSGVTADWASGTPFTFAGSISLGGSTLNVSGSYTDTSNWNFDANGSTSIFGTSVSAAGSISDSAGAITGSYTMSMGSLTIAPGLSVTGLTMAWDPDHGVTGSGSIVLGSARISITVGYQDSSNWTFTATTNGTGTVTVLPGINIGGASFTGTISEASGILNWRMSVNMPTTTLISNLATLVNPTFSISNSCPAGLPAAMCPTGNTTFLSATGTLQMNLGLGLGTQNVSLIGVYGVQTGGFDLTAGFGTITVVPGLLAITSPSISLSYGEGKTVSTGSIGGFGNGTVSGYTISIAGTVALSLPGFNQSLPVLLTYGLPSVGAYNFNLSSDFPSLGTLGSTGAILSDFAFTSVSTSISLNGLSVTVPANTLVLGGQFVLPSWVATYLGKALSNVSLYATYTSPTWYSVSGVFPTSLPMPTGSPDFSFSITSFSVTLSMGLTGYTQTLSAGGQFKISGSAGDSTIDITLGLSYQDATAQITGSISASAQQGYLWQNAFGMPGINLQAFAISVGIELATTPIPLPSLGLAASLVITGSLASNLGIVSGTPIEAILNISATNPCMDVQIGTPGGPKAISIGGGLFTANYADFVLAPDGCTVGTYVVAPGFAFDFQGTFFGVAISVSTTVAIDPVYAPAIDFSGTLSVGAFNIENYVNFQGATVSLAFTPVSFSCSFSGTATILGVTVSMSGAAAENSDAGTSSMSLAASVSSFSVYGFTLSDVSFAIAYDQSPSHVNFTLSASGKMSILGNWLSVNEMTFTFSNGVVNTIYIDVSADINVSGVLIISGDFTLSASMSSSNFLLTATGKVKIGGFSLVISACPNNQPGLTISNSGFTLCSATLSESFFTATVSGQMYWSAPPSGTTIKNATGQTVTAQAGDFNFAATNVSMNICGFGVYGAVNIGTVGGVFFASGSASLGLSNTSSDQLVYVAGSFDSTGNFSFTGTGSVKLAAISFNLSVNASVQGSAVSVTANTNLSISGSNFALSGSFISVNGGVKTTMSLTANLTIGGFNLGQASVTLSVKPGTELVTVTDSMSLAGIFTASLNGTLGAVNGTAVFNFSLSAGINIPGVSVSGTLKLSNCTTSSCTAAGPFTASVSGQFKDFAGTSYSFNPIGVNSNWSFTVSTSGSTNSCTGWTSLGLIKYQSCFAGSYSLMLSTGSPYLAFSLGFQASVKAANWVVSTHCHGKWYNPRSWKCDTTSKWGSTYNLISVGASVDSNGNVRASYAGITFKFTI